MRCMYSPGHGNRLANRASIKQLRGCLVMAFEQWCECAAMLMRSEARARQLSGTVSPRPNPELSTLHPTPYTLSPYP